MIPVFHWVVDHKYSGIFTLLVLGIVGLPIPDEGVLAFAGYLVYKGKLVFLPCLASAFVGSVCGITLSYVLGHTLGIYLLEKYGAFVGITRKKLDVVHHWFEHAGKWTLVFGYFVPGVRHLTAFVAGSSKLEFYVFAPFAYAGGFVWSLTFILLGYFFGREFSRTFAEIHHSLVNIVGILAVIALLYLLVRGRLSNRK